MFHYESITSQLNETPDKNKKNFEQENFQYWFEYQSSLSPWILKIDQDFIDDKFNSYNIICRHNIDDVMRFIFFGDYSQDEIKENSIIKDFSFDHYKNDENLADLYEDALSVFTQIHQRFVISQQGLQIMKRKYESGSFGQCPRFSCDGQHLLPIGFDYEPNKSKLCGWCPKCQDVYDINSDLDGAFYGPSFPHYFLQMTKNDLKNKPKPQLQLTYYGIPIES